MPCSVPRSSYYARLRRGPSRRGRRQPESPASVNSPNSLSPTVAVYGSLADRVFAKYRHCLQPQPGGPAHASLAAQSLPKRAFKLKTTQGQPSSSHRPQFIGRGAQSSRPTGSGSATSFMSSPPKGWLYLAAVMDLYSRKIAVGWATADQPQNQPGPGSSPPGGQSPRPQAGWLHHSDRGCQYASAEHSRLPLLSKDPSQHELNRQLLRQTPP